MINVPCAANVFDDSSTDSSDDDAGAPRVYQARHNTNMDNMADDEFVSNFRLNKAGFEYVHESVADMIRPARMYAYSLTTRERLLVCIRLVVNYSLCHSHNNLQIPGRRRTRSNHWSIIRNQSTSRERYCTSMCTSYYRPVVGD